MSGQPGGIGSMYRESTIADISHCLLRTDDITTINVIQILLQHVLNAAVTLALMGHISI
jgi:hypothetical protein